MLPKELSRQHIEDYLSYYFSLEISPNYAILLRGKWGSGKSWFMKKYFEDNLHFKHYYISLFGVTKFSEIQDEIFRQSHPILTSKTARIAGSIAKTLLKATLKIDFNNDKKEDGTWTIAMPELELKEYLKSLSDRILVFDDLERCSIPIHSVLGYINQFVENDGLKVVIIANEEEVIKRNKSSKESLSDSENYQLIKEKIIGKSFEIKANSDAAIVDFIDSASNEDTKAILIANSNTIKDIFKTANYNNLRHVRQSILDFDRFCTYLPTEAKAIPELVEQLIKIFFPISFELKKGVIIEDDIRVLFYRKLSLEGERDLQSIVNKYSFLTLFNSPISEKLLGDFFKNGGLDKEDVLVSLKNSSFFKKEEEKPNWIKLWNYYDLTDEDFSSLSQEIFSDFINNNIKNKYIFLQILGMLLSFSEKGFIKQDKTKIIDIARRNFDLLKGQDGFRLKRAEEFPSESSHGLGYQSSRSAEFIELVDYMRNGMIETILEVDSTAIDKLMAFFKMSVDKFGDLILLRSSLSEYYDIPVLKYLPLNEFLERFDNLSNRDKKELGWIIEKRYSNPEFIKNLKSELEWLKQVRERVESGNNGKVNTISGFTIENGFLKSLRGAINTLENYSDLS